MQLIEKKNSKLRQRGLFYERIILVYRLVLCLVLKFYSFLK